jgi:diguanylate cyclase (GGDEF)-like protein
MLRFPATRLRARHRRAQRALGDGYVQLSFALALAATLASLVDPASDTLTIAGLAATLVIFQGAIATSRTAPAAGEALPLVRLLLVVAFVAAANVLIGGSRPLMALYIPIVAYAAAVGRREGLLVGLLVAGLYVAPLVGAGASATFFLQRFIAHAGVLAVIAIGTRRTIGALNRTVRAARRASLAERRRASQAAGIEQVGRALAGDGLTDESLEATLDLLVERFGYPYVSIYLRQGDIMQLGAQRGYADPILTFPAEQGIIGRVLRTQAPVLLTDVAADPDYVSADASIRSEVCVPMIVGGEFLGVVNVEADGRRQLDQTDLGTMLLVADRLASALALSRDRGRLAERAELFTRLTESAIELARPLEIDGTGRQVAEIVARAVPADMIAVVTDGAGGEEFRISAILGGDERFAGARIARGDGMAGRAIETGDIVYEPRLPRADFPRSVRGAAVPDMLATVAAPIVVDGRTLGALSLSRTDLDRGFSDLERATLGLLAVQVGLAIVNFRLHRELRDASELDALTGLHNRRHLDASIGRLMAARSRLAPTERRPVSAILFDLDHFGQVNKLHGHQVGDDVLRAFAALLRARFRSADVVGRQGGEEFLAILDGASRAEAAEVADEVRLAFGSSPVVVSERLTLTPTVSAGVAELDPTSSSADVLLELCDVGLVMAKQSGRNRVVAA